MGNKSGEPETEAVMSKREKTKYPGVFWIEGISAAGKPERIYYIRYKKKGRSIEEPVGRQYQDDMTAARASLIRIRRIEGDELPNREKRSVGKGMGKTLHDVFLEYMEAKHLKSSTQERDKKKFSRWLKKYSDSSPSEITQKTFDDLVKEMKSEGKAPQTIKHIAGMLARLVRFSAEKGYSPALAVRLELPRINNEKTEDLTPEEIQRFLKAMDEDPHPCAGKMMKLALFTGMRLGEICRLEWRDIDLEKNFISIREPKSGKDKKIPLNETARALLESVSVNPRIPYVFPNEDGSLRKDIRDQASRIRAAAGLPKDFRPMHGLRHVFASTLASSGQVDMYTLQKLLTHSDPKTTQRYAHLRDEALKRASDIAGDIFGRMDSSADNGDIKD